MEYLTFTCGEQEYAIDVKEIKELIPLVKIYSLPHLSENFIGYINYRGKMIPVLDLAVFLGYLPAQINMSTRIVVMNFLKKDGSELLMGVIVENAVKVEQFDDSEVIQPDINIIKHPVISKIIIRGERSVYLITFRSLKTLQLET